MDRPYADVNPLSPLLSYCRTLCFDYSDLTIWLTWQLAFHCGFQKLSFKGFLWNVDRPGVCWWNSSVVLCLWQVVVLTNSSLAEQQRIADHCHESDVAVIIADTRGLFGCVPSTTSLQIANIGCLIVIWLQTVTLCLIMIWLQTV